MAAREQLVTAIESVVGKFEAELIDSLNNAVRRLKQAETREEWKSTLVAVASEFCARAAVFEADEVEGAPAFRNALQTADTVVAVGSARELSTFVLDKLGGKAAPRVYLFPIRAVVLYAEPDPINVSALELLTSFPAPPAASPNKKPEELRAQRFARTRVAELILRRREQIGKGRAQNNLYATLKEDIDSAREDYRRQFPTLHDFLHQELVRTLAKDNASALGAGYPGPLSTRTEEAAR